MSTVFNAVLQSSEFQNAKSKLLDAILSKISTIDSVKKSESTLVETYEKLVTDLGHARGRDLFYKYVASGAGNGALIELADGSVKYDLITGIGVNFFGHGNLDLFSKEIDAAWGSIMSGNLGPGGDQLILSKKLIDSVPKTKLKKVWVSTCGATVNEIALKIIRQKKSPASRIFAFQHCFAGRTTALQEITDNPAYRQGQPLYGEVSYLPFYDASSKATPKEQADAAIKVMLAEIQKNPEKYAGIEFEIVQGEGGFANAPGDFLKPILIEAKKQGLYVWVDEVQTFGRTGELFCFQKIGIDEFVDVVTAAKLLQVGVCIFSEELNPKPGLISGTFTGSTAAMKAAIEIVDILNSKMCGKNGRIYELEKLTINELDNIKKSSNSRFIKDTTVYGGMVAFGVFDQSLDWTKKFLFKLWDNGVIAFYCGHGPYRIRMLPPFGVITDKQWKEVWSIVDQTIGEVADEFEKGVKT